MPTLDLETWRCEIDGHLARLRMNRPQALNAANWAWVRDLVVAGDYLASSREAHVVIVSGEGRAFCSGLDVKELAQGNLTRQWFATWEKGVMTLANLDAITIAAIQGYCLGGGLQVAVACDLRIAATDAVMSIPAVREGVVAALGPMRLARLIGLGPAKRLCLLGHRFSAQDGQALGLIDEVCEPADLEARALAMAHELLSIPFTALKHTKKQLNAAFTQDDNTLLQGFLDGVDDCLTSPEHLAVMQQYREQQAQKRQ